jgi:hypothetical protein
MPSLSALTARVEERFLVPTYGGRWPFAPIAAHRGLSLPLQLTGPVRRATVLMGDVPVQVVGIGREKLISPLLSRLLGPEASGWAEPRHGLWSPATLARFEADLIVAEVHRWMAPRFRRAGWLLVPQAVRWGGEMGHVPGPTPPHTLREDLRKIGRQGFTLTQAASQGDWERFATRMVAPQARTRFGDEAWVPSPRLMREFMRVGTLHLVHRGAEVVAGMVSVPRGDTIWFPVSGVRDGDPALFRSGAGLATLALSIEWARAQGFRRIDAGRTSPFLTDGVQQLKRKWGLRPTADPLTHLAAVRIVSPAVRAAFARQPVYVEAEGGLRRYDGEAV